MRANPFEAMRAGALAAMVVAAAIAPAAAQTLPPVTGEDLTVPPEFRHVPPVRPQAAGRPAARGASRAARRVTPGPQDRSAAREAAPAASAKAGAAHPVDVGVVVRGGSATPRVISPLGSSEAVQESGSAVGAAMRFGF